MDERSLDRRVIQCNYAVSTSVAAAGARAYVIRPNGSNGYGRVEILVFSRGKRMVRKWESIKRLTNFRPKTIPVVHGLSLDERLYDYDVEETAARLNEAAGQAGS